MDAIAQPLPVGDAQHSGRRGVTNLVKHTALRNPVTMVVIIAALAALVVLLAYHIYQTRPAKAGFTTRVQGRSAASNFDNGSNNPQAFNAELTGPISVGDAGYHPGSTIYADTVVNPDSVAAVRARLGGDAGSAASLVHMLGDTSASAEIGSACAAASARALAEHQAHLALNGGTSGGMAT